ncbi:hypothetical protein [Metapseudomonas furukawaii]|jgi:hypothetical protein|uniref:hypothetical protein n=1 Tax=Metapseudomonas furukawaii TaxID=1149133 RepID=UPI000FA2CCBA|nr:hypothetical protein [Pseudomonas furukawaii]WAG78886.1 hypothetical protein LMK08_26680 [Pseudomonas furukawaii]
MKMACIVALSAVVLGSSYSFAEDGYGRSLEMNREFRENQAKIHGENRTESAADKAEEKSEENKLNSAHEQDVSQQD